MGNSGFINTATWVVFRDVFSNVIPYQIMGCDRKPSVDELARSLRLIAVNQIYETSNEGLARDYALAFLLDVNWYEIAKHMIDAYEKA